MKEVKMIFCSNCGKKFIPVGREHICPACKQEAAQAAKRAAVERAKMRSYTGEACPVRISARARGFIEHVAAEQGTKFIPALDTILQAVCKDYGFQSWKEVPEHKTARRTSKAAKVATTVTPAAPATPVKASTPSKAAEPVKATSKVSKTGTKASKTNKA